MLQRAPDHFVSGPPIVFAVATSIRVVDPAPFQVSSAPPSLQSPRTPARPRGGNGSRHAPAAQGVARRVGEAGATIASRSGPVFGVASLSTKPGPCAWGPFATKRLLPVRSRPNRLPTSEVSSLRFGVELVWRDEAQLDVVLPGALWPRTCIIC